MDWRSPAVEEIEALSADLARLASVLDEAEAVGTEDALWETELGLLHVGRRCQARADDLRRVIERRRKRPVA